jgi:ATP-binding cassette subfamily B protein
VAQVVSLLLEKLPADDFYDLALVALAAICGRFVLAGISTFIAHKGAFRIQNDIRFSVAKHLADIPMGYVTKRRSGELKKVLADDVERLELFLAHAIPDLVAATLTFLCLAIWMILIDWRLTIATFFLVVPALLCIGFAMRRAGVHATEYKTTQGAMNAAIVELVQGMPVVRMFNRDDDEVRSTEEMIRRYVTVVRDYSLEFLPFGTAFYVLLSANVVLIVPVGGWLWLNGEVATEDFLFFLIVGVSALSSLVSLLFLFANLSHIASGGRLVQEILEQSKLDSLDQTKDLPTDRSVSFENVSFRYEEQWVLQNINLQFPEGSLTALVGPSGAGKTTAASLISRFWDPSEGRICIGGIDIRAMSPEALAKSVSVVLQDTFLFDDTIRNNLKIGKVDATNEKIEQAARLAAVHETIMALPSGYDTFPGEHGQLLSGGERQRITIARAILADAPIVVLDEATAFVDPENELLLQRAIGELIKNKTVIMIAHRLTTITGAKNIVVLDNGRVVEQGAHDALRASSGLYASLWDDFNAASEISIGGGS